LPSDSQDSEPGFQCLALELVGTPGCSQARLPCQVGVPLQCKEDLSRVVHGVHTPRVVLGCLDFASSLVGAQDELPYMLHVLPSDSMDACVPNAGCRIVQHMRVSQHVRTCSMPCCGFGPSRPLNPLDRTKVALSEGPSPPYINTLVTKRMGHICVVEMENLLDFRISPTRSGGLLSTPNWSCES
jgi:hypothetical protein